MREIKKLIVHCSGTPDNREVTVDEIRQWHLKRGWSDIGYHYLVCRDGTIRPGRRATRIGAHCKGQNKDSIGVCLIGRDTFTNKQLDSLQKLYDILKNIFEIQIYGHKDFTNKKTCPNFNVKEMINDII